MTFDLNGVSVGLSVCEDIWEPGPPAMSEALAGAPGAREHLRLAVPRRIGRHRERMIVQRAADYLAAVVFVNTVGGQDELVFDGHSVAMGPTARCWPAGPSSRRTWRWPPSIRARWWPPACATPGTV